METEAFRNSSSGGNRGMGTTIAKNLNCVMYEHSDLPKYVYGQCQKCYLWFRKKMAWLCFPLIEACGEDPVIKGKVIHMAF